MAKTKNSRSFNMSILVGLTMSTAVLVLSVAHSTSTPWIFLNLVGILIVVGGIAASSLIMYPFAEIRRTVGALMRNIRYSSPSLSETIYQLTKLSEALQQDPNLGSRIPPSVQEPFLRDAYELLSSGMRVEDVKRQLEIRVEGAEELTMSQSAFLLTLAKLGPAFGLLGTLVGLVVLLQDMGSGGNFDQAGPALAISLLATLYGVITANLFLQPCAEYLRYSAEQEKKLSLMVIEGIVMIADRKHPISIRESLKSWLPKDEHAKFNRMFASRAPATAKTGKGGKAAA